jgi:O-antigen ligase
LLALAGVELLIAGHAALTARLGAVLLAPEAMQAYDPPRLLREALKLVTIPVQLAMVLALASAFRLERQRLWPSLLAVGVIAGIVLYQRYTVLSGGPLGYPNIEANSLAGAAAFTILLLWQRGGRAQFGALALALAVTFVMVLGIRKIFVALGALWSAAIAGAFWQAARTAGNRRPLRHALLAIGLAALIIVGVQLMLGPLVYANKPITVLVDSFTASLAGRLTIARIAIEAGLAALPWGVGIGQFGALAARTPELAGTPVGFIHNTLLTLAVEMGLLGILLGCGLLALIIHACRGRGPIATIVLAGFFLLPMAFHDTHGLRMTILLLGYFANRAASTAAADACGTSGKASLDSGSSRRPGSEDADSRS